MDPNSGLDLRERPSMTYMPLDGKEKIYSSTGLRWGPGQAQVDAWANLGILHLSDERQDLQGNRL